MDTKLKKLRVYNGVMGMFHLLQGGLMLWLSNGFKLPIETSFLKWNQAAGFPVTSHETLFDLRVGPVVASFLFISAIFHFLIATVGFKQYTEWLSKGANYFRWWEYSLSSSAMIVVIAMLCGVYDLGSLILLFALNATMILFGYMMELHNQTTKKIDWTAFIFGCFAGMVPWIVMGMYFFAAIGSNSSAVPAFVYGIFWSLFVFFNVFAINMFLQYKKIGPWKDYMFGEVVYVLLSLIAKSLLAWQVWGGTLR
jgi:hypothetical protein